MCKNFHFRCCKSFTSNGRALVIASFLPHLDNQIQFPNNCRLETTILTPPVKLYFDAKRLLDDFKENHAHDCKLSNRHLWTKNKNCLRVFIVVLKVFKLKSIQRAPSVDWWFLKRKQASFFIPSFVFHFYILLQPFCLHSKQNYV